MKRRHSDSPTTEDKHIAAPSSAHARMVGNRARRGWFSFFKPALPLLLIGTSGAIAGLLNVHADSIQTRVYGSAATRASDSLAGVTCPTASFCIAVGGYADDPNSLSFPLVEQLRENRWIVSGETAAGGTAGRLKGVGCAGPSTCFAVGESGQSSLGSSSLFRALIERWSDKLWSTVSAPKVPGATKTALNGISCVGPSDCFAVGDFIDDLENTYPLIERWDGKMWSVMDSPIPGRRTAKASAFEYLDAITCTAESNCFAVGHDSSHVRPLLEQWDGSQWSIVAAPEPTGATNPVLDGVACTSSICFAVGSWRHGNGNKSAPLIEAWNGATWALQTLSAPASGTQTLAAIACLPSSNCFAVGRGRPSPGSTRSLVEQWGAGHWSDMANPNPSGAASTKLSGIACYLKTCYAVGDSTGAAGQLTLIDRWIKSGWTVVPSPNK